METEPKRSNVTSDGVLDELKERNPSFKLHGQVTNDSPHLKSVSIADSDTSKYTEQYSLLFQYKAENVLDSETDKPTSFNTYELVVCVSSNATTCARAKDIPEHLRSLSYHKELFIKQTPRGIYSPGCYGRHDTNSIVGQTGVWCKCFGEFDCKQIPLTLKSPIEFLEIPAASIVLVLEKNVKKIDWNSPEDIKKVLEILESKRQPLSNLEFSLKKSNETLQGLYKQIQKLQKQTDELEAEIIHGDEVQDLQRQINDLQKEIEYEESSKSLGIKMIDEYRPKYAAIDGIIKMARADYQRVTKTQNQTGFVNGIINFISGYVQ